MCVCVRACVSPIKYKVVLLLHMTWVSSSVRERVSE